MFRLPASCCAALLAVPLCAAGAQGLDAELAAERTHLLAGSSTLVGAVLTVQAPEAPDGMEPANVAISLVIDRSGSMKAAGKISMVHVAGADLVDRLESADELGIVAYSTEVETLRPMDGLTEPEGVKQLIRQLTPTNSTNLGGGLEAGIGLFGERRDDSPVRRLLMLTDGLANQGETRPEVLAQWAKDAFLQKGARVSAVGLGEDYNEDLLTKLAHGGGGEFYHVTDRTQLPELFRTELEEGRTVVVKDLSTTCRLSPGARFLEMVGYPFTGGDENAREVRLGDFFSREKRTILLRFKLAPPDDVAQGIWRAAVLELGWKDEGGARRGQDLALEFTVTYSETDVAGSVDPEIRVRVIENENYRALDEAMNHFRKGERDKALDIIKAAQERITKDESVGGDMAIIEQAGQLAQARREIEQRVDPNLAAKFGKQQSRMGYRGGKKAWLMAAQQARGGGSFHSHAAVGGALSWLVKSQAPDGSWDASAHGGRAGDRQHATSLALLALLASGHTEKTGAYQQNCKKAVAWLVSRRQPDGRIGEAGELPHDPLARYRIVREHAIATLALAEACAMARAPGTVKVAQEAIDCLVAARPLDGLDKTLSGARGPTDGDIAGVGWCVIAFKCASIAGFRVPRSAFDEAVRFLDSCEVVEAGKTTGRFSFSGGEAKGLDTMVGSVSRMLLGAGRDRVLPAVKWAVSRPKGLPSWGKGGDDFEWYYAYFGNLACFQMGSDAWKTWNDALRDQLVKAQEKGTPETEGSWAPTGTLRGRDRVTSSSLAALCLQVYYRYLPMYHF